MATKKTLVKKAAVKKVVAPKKVSRRVSKKQVVAQSEIVYPEMTETAVPATFSTQRPLGQRLLLIVAGLTLIAGLVVMTNKSLLVVAMVDGQPIYRWDLSKALMTQFGKQMVDSIITERLIAGAAKKANITITQKDIDVKEQEIVASFGGKVTVEELLKFQGMTKTAFDAQIKTQLIVSKIVGKDIVISDADIATFLEKNKDTMVATEEGKLKDEAKTALFNQKVSEKVQPWFTELRAKANIQTFIK